MAWRGGKETHRPNPRRYSACWSVGFRFVVRNFCRRLCHSPLTLFFLLSRARSPPTHSLSSVANVRSHLAAAVPLSDQILLLGPPYKVPKDSTLQTPEILKSLRLGDAEDDPIAEDSSAGNALQSLASERKPRLAASSTSSLASSQKSNLATTERTGARRLFLFSKRALSEHAVDPPPCRLQPMELSLPTEAPGPSPLNMAQSVAASPPLFQALTAYERQFMLYLCQGRVLADGADLRLSACRQCVQEQVIMARALRAAVSNLSDHYNGHCFPDIRRHSKGIP